MNEHNGKILVLPVTAHRYSLRPLFALNRALREVRYLAKEELEGLRATQEAKKTSPHIVPYLYDKRSRTFLTYGFTDEALGSEEAEQPEKILEKIKQLTIDNKDEKGEIIPGLSLGQWQHYLKHVRFSNERRQEKSNIEIKIEKCVGLIAAFFCQYDKLSEELTKRQEMPLSQLEDTLKRMTQSDEQTNCLKLAENVREILHVFSYAEWMEIYAHHHQSRNMHLNGRFFNLLHQAHGGRLHDVSGSNISALDALVFKILDRKNETTRGRDIQVYSLSRSQQEWKDLGCEKQNLGQGEAGKDEKGDYHGAQIHFELTTLFALPGEVPPWVLLIPVYDYYVAGRGYGGICATLQIPLYNEELDIGKGGAASVAVEKLISCAQILSLEIAASGIERAIRDQVAPRHTAISEFIKGLCYLQDWECVNISLSDSKSLHYKRIVTGCGDSELTPNTNNKIDNQSKRKDEVTLSWSRTAIKDGDAVANVVNFEYIEGTEKDLSEFSELKEITFYFPMFFRLPEREITGDDGIAINPFWRAYCDDLIRQQRELLSVLKPKLRARKAALRSAVSAIMGRNMSHNIGSHVLARYSSAIKHDLDPAGKDYSDHRTDFLSYLQRRMDFLAEVATSDKAFWEQPLSLHDAINKLNLEKQQDRIEADEPCSATCSQSPTTPGTLVCSRLKTPSGAKKNEPILLSYITGKESLVANVGWGNPPNTGKVEPSKNTTYFSCPGGEVGVHALYVILENIIRNSARHVKSNEGKSVDVYVSVSDENLEENNLIKLTIIDPRTRLDKEGWVMDKEDTQVGGMSLTAHINEILKEEPFLNEDGSTNPKYWGVREMQICAHYLRVLPLGDLESEPEQPAVLEANSWEYKKDGKTGYYLSYTLYLKRAQLLAYIETSSGPEDKNRDKKLLSRGIKPIYRDKAENKEKGVGWWQEIADESRGYSFLALSPDLMGKYKYELKTDASLKYALPVRTIEMDVVGKLIKKTDGDTALNWMQPLHEAMIKKYRNNGDKKTVRWGNGDVYAVVAWFGEQGGECIPCNLGGGLHYLQVKFSNIGDNVPFSDLPGGLPPLGTDPPNNLGLAWLDHANDNDLMSKGGGNPLSASFNRNSPRNWASVEPLWSDSSHRQVLIDYSPDGMSELAAAALARVVVLDERIQSRRHDIVRAVTLYKYWPQTGIWCPFRPDDVKGMAGKQLIVKASDAYHDVNCPCDLDEPRFSAIQDFLKQPTKLDYQLPADFLVLHLTILERLNKERHKDHPEESINKTLTELVRGTQCECAQIVIVTGRGVPTTARHRDENGRVDARYLPISALQEFLVTRPSKLGLMRVLWASAAPRIQS